MASLLNEAGSVMSATSSQDCKENLSQLREKPLNIINEYDKDEKSIDGVNDNIQQQGQQRSFEEAAKDILDPMHLPDTGYVVSGISGRFPSANTIEELKQKLTDNCDMCLDHDDKRWPFAMWGLPPRAGRIEDISRFDAEFFGYNRDVLVEPQLRILYEVVYESIVDSGLNPASLRGTNTGLFMGLHTNEFDTVMWDEPNFQPNGYFSQLAIKVAEYLDIKGLVCTYDLACASGFGALHNAMTSLRQSEIDQAIVCAVNVSVHPRNSIGFVELSMLSPVGYSKFGDASVDGYVKAEACVSVFLQNKTIALRNYCSLLATGINVDGFKKEGITFPSASAQETLIRETKKLVEGLHSDHVEVIEAHGTGTPAGDPIECKALSEVYCPKEQVLNERTIGPLLLGSIKTNMGHSEGVSGLCSLAKVILMLENEIIYKSLHFEKPNPNIDSLVEGRAQIVTENRRLNSKVIPMSCYGFGGANVHAITRSNNKDIVKPIEEHVDVMQTNEAYRLVLMFGRTEQGVQSFFDSITSDAIKEKALTRDFLALVDSLSSGPIDRLMSYRGYMLVNLKTQQELFRSISECKLLPPPLSDHHNQSSCDIGRSVHHFQDSQARGCYFVYPGLGSQWTGMASGLKQCKPFWATIERLDAILASFDFHLIQSLDNQTLDKSDQNNNNGFSIVDSFVGITAIQIALTNILKSNVDVKPASGAGIMGHSIGEVACAYADEILDEREAILLVYRLARTLQENAHLIEGSMVALGLALEDAQLLIEEFNNKNAKQQSTTLYVSCDNGPESVTVSGTKQHMKDFLNYVETEKEVQYTDLNIDFALHNPYVMSACGVKSKLLADARKLLHVKSDYSRRKMSRWFSTIDSCSRKGEIPESIAANAEYFVNNLCKRVNFKQALNRIDNPDNSVIVEVGPHGIFESIIKQQFKGGSSKDELQTIKYVKLMKKNDQDPTLTLFKGLGGIFESGGRINLALGQLYPAVEFPVRKQVPSLSSLLRWDHSRSHYVPKYPEKFSQSSEKTLLQVDLLETTHKYLSGHCIEGRILFPATGYLTYIWLVFSYVKRNMYDLGYSKFHDEFVPIEFRNVRLHRAIILNESDASTLDMRLEAATGYFEFVDNGQVVVDGYVKSPEIEGQLLYENVADDIKKENLELCLDKDDIYKQFRVNGYDYGETFRCIDSASSDGRHVKIKFNGHLIALTDNILQSIFLSICSQAPHNILFLPTGFDYIRFEPELLLSKIRKSGMTLKEIKQSTSSNSREAHNMMTEVSSKSALDNNNSEQTNGAKKLEEELSSKEIGTSDTESICIFDTFCNPVLGIVVTDGIELRGIRATPVYRRELAKPLLESYKFVPDIEEPVVDLELSLNSSRERYDLICTNIVHNLLNTCNIDSLQQLDRNGNETANPKQKVDIDLYCRNHLTVRRGELNKQLNSSLVSNDDSNNNAQILPEPTKSNDHEETNVKRQLQKELTKNCPFALLSLFDTLLFKLSEVANFNVAIADNNNDETRSDMSQPMKVKLLSSELMSAIEEHGGQEVFNKDMMLSSFNCERFTRPIVEIMIENICHSSNKFRLLEINNGDNIQMNYLQSLVADVTSNITLEYTVAHPDPASLSLDSTVRVHTLKDIEHKTESSLLSLMNKERPIDAICLCDSSCYAVQMDDIESNGLGPILTNLTKVIRKDGFLLMMIRYKITFAERFIMAAKQLNLSDSVSFEMFSSGPVDEAVLDRMRQIQFACEARIRLLEREAQRCQFELISTKKDTTGCAIYLYKNKTNIDHVQNVDESHGLNSLHEIIHVKHADYGTWFNRLKELLNKQEDNNQGDQDQQKQQHNSKEVARKTIWLCAVGTRDKPINGIVGMMQCLRREMGKTTNLRCFYDSYTFNTKLESEITIEGIQSSENFRLARERDLLWSCIDSTGRWGSFRHLTLDNYYDTGNKTKCPIEESQLIETDNAYANVSTRGDLSSFNWFEGASMLPNELNDDTRRLINVNYSALNFKDVMMASGRLPLDAIPLKLAMADCLLGLEFSGLDAVSKKRVAGMVYCKGIATKLMCHKELTFEVPDSMSLKEAASLPVVYLTAILSLICRGKMQPGESILVHAGSGGVGQAAIRLALNHKLKVFTTVGTEEKRRFILEEFNGAITDDQIFSSRDCRFEMQIMRATAGRGVDLVLNSLADDKLQASVRCLADNGRFLEIGKYDQAVNAKLELIRMDTNKTFHSVHLDKLFDEETVTEQFREQVRVAATMLANGVKDGTIKPIRHTCFAKEDIEQAFRFMATGKHIGKILIEIEPESKLSSSDLHQSNKPANAIAQNKTLRAVPRFQFDPSKSYIVTGGLGGFGLELIKWMALEGARNIVVTSRTGVRTGYQRVLLDRLKQHQNCNILVVDGATADGTSQNGVERLFELAKEHSPSDQIGGLFHLAVVLKDNLIEKMTSEDFELVCRPKADACLLLDEISRERAPEMSLFVAFSSVSCGKGNGGQLNYGYANSVMERICEQRRKDNLHGLAIQWGAIGDVGIAYETLGGNDIVIGGTVPQRMPSCFSTLAQMLCSPFAVCSSVVQLDKKSQNGALKGDLVAAVLHVLGIKDASKVDEQSTLAELGLDSLMAVEIRQYIEREFETSLSVQEIRLLTIAKIREIGEKGKSATATKNDASNNSDGNGKTGASMAADVMAASKKLDKLKQMGTSFSAGFDLTFKPALELPKMDFVHLNDQRNGAPVFVLTHVYGSFDLLKSIGQQISRPCIGLNYTNKLNKMTNFFDMAEYYFEYLNGINWAKLFNIEDTVESDGSCRQVVDIIGYSFGSVVSYELLALIQQKRAANSTNLFTGCFVLLDMSPKLIGILGESSESFVETRVDDILVSFIAHHTKSLKELELDYDATLKRLRLIQTGLEDKFVLTRDTLSQALSVEDKSQQADMLDAIEAYYRRYQALSYYRSHRSYTGQATLIRAEEDVVVNIDGNKTPDDYLLTEVVNGKIDWHKFPGNHESFLIDNTNSIANIINSRMNNDAINM